MCVRRKKTKKTKKNPAAPETHHEIHSSPATAITSRRRATKRPTRYPYSPASIGFNSILVKWRPDLKKETENIICWTGEERKIIWLVCVPAVHGLRTSMSPQFSTTTYCVVLLNQHGNPPQHCHVPCHGGSMEGSRAAQTLTLSSIDRGVLRFFSGMWITRNR